MNPFIRHLANAVTVIRIFLVLPLSVALWNQHYAEAFIFFLIAGFSDAFDGLIARHFHAITRFGSIADPLSDKLLLIASFVLLAWRHEIPVWLVVLMVCRDIWIVAGAWTYHRQFGRYDVTPRLLSKMHTVLQIVLIGSVLLNLSFYALPELFLKACLYCTVATCLLSWLDYTWVWGHRAWQQVKQRRIAV